MHFFASMHTCVAGEASEGKPVPCQWYTHTAPFASAATKRVVSADIPANMAYVHKHAAAVMISG